MATLSLTKQFVEVAGQRTDGELRVLRQYISVLTQSGAPALEESANNTINFVEVVHGWIEDRAFSSSMNLTDDATATIFNENQDVADTLNLTHTAIGARDIPLGVSHTISFVSNGGRSLTWPADTALSLSHIIVEFNYVADRAPVGNTLNLTQTVLTLSSVPVAHDLGLTQTLVVQSPFKPMVNDWLGLSQHVSTPYHMFVEDELALAQVAGVPLPTQVITHTLNLTDDSPIGGCSSEIVFVQTVTWGFSLTATSTLNVTDALVVTANFIRLVEQDLGIGHALTWYEDTPCGRKQYTPFQGENTITTDVTPPPVQLQDPQGSTLDRFVLYQPAIGAHTSEVTLRAPELDNRDRNAYSRISRETRGGELVVYADPTWPKVRTLAITMIGLLESQVDELHTFLQNTIGQNIGLTDWEGRRWQGFITNPNEVATQDGKARWTVSLEFEGEMMIDTYEPGEAGGDGRALNLSQSVTAVIV
jgi:hypothetical protein